MSRIPVYTAIRIIPRENDFLERRLGTLGEIFYDRDTNTLKLFDGDNAGGIALVKEDLSNVSNSVFAAKATAAGVGSSGGGASVDVSSSVPSEPENGNLWLNTQTGRLYIYVEDEDSGQWIQPNTPFPGSLTDIGISDGTNGQFLKTDGDGNFSFATLNYVTPATLSTTLEDYVTETALTTTLEDYVTETALTTTLEDYVTDTSLTTTLANIDDWDTAYSWGDHASAGYAASTDLGSFTFTGTVIDTDDSSGIVFTPLVSIASDLTVENELFVNNSITTNSLIVQGPIKQGLEISGLTTLYASTDVITTKTGATGVVEHDISQGMVFYHSSIAADFTANFINCSVTDNRTLNTVLILEQGATARIPTAVQINGSSETINWLDAAGAPTGNNNEIDVVNFTFIRTSGQWTVLGSLVTYG